MSTPLALRHRRGALVQSIVPGRFRQQNREALGHMVKVFGQPLSTEAENGHLIVHRVERVRVVVVLVMNEPKRAIKGGGAERDPLRRGKVTQDAALAVRPPFASTLG